MNETGAEVNLIVSRDVVRPIVEKKISMAIIEALGNQEEFIEEIIKKVLTEKVNADGKVSSYSSENPREWFSLMCRNSIRDFAVSALKEWMETKREVIKKTMVKSLNNQTKQVVDSFVCALVESAGNEYKYGFEIVVKKNKE